jgi:small subunit ribosomal protein S4
MSRFTGPRVRKMRALGTDLPGLSRKHIERRPYPPGQHGQSRKKLSEFALRLQEKQKLTVNYGLGERQFRALMVKAHAMKGNTGDCLLELLERRLDNVVFRAGFARTIPAARQLVNHGHVLVNGKRVDIPSFRVALKDKISLREKSRKIPAVLASISDPVGDAAWLTVNKEELTAEVIELPGPTSVLFPINVQLVVEFYSERT